MAFQLYTAACKVSTDGGLGSSSSCLHGYNGRVAAPAAAVATLMASAFCIACI
jgi:hypothetical protein